MEKLNIAEILKDCPKGMELDCTIFDDVYFDYIDNVGDVIKCYIQDQHQKNNISFNKYGCYSYRSKSKCVIFPKGKTTWEGFQRPVKDGDVVVDDSGAIFLYCQIHPHYEEQYADFYCGLTSQLRSFVIKTAEKQHCGKISYIRLATEEEKQKLFDAIKANGYRWNDETKTLEKLIVPKFKVGDRITNNKVSITIGYIDDEYYYEIGRNIANRLFIKNQDDWELVPNKFDITTLKPFDKVLVRCSLLEKWHIQFFENYNKQYSAKYPFICLCNSKYSQCIPYHFNEHLLNTTNDCDDYYKTWE